MASYKHPILLNGRFYSEIGNILWYTVQKSRDGITFHGFSNCILSYPPCLKVITSVGVP